MLFVLSLLVSPPLKAPPLEGEPPFLTNTAAPVPYQQGNFYILTRMSSSASATFIQGPALAGRYGVHPRFDFFVNFPINTHNPKHVQPGNSRSTGLGDVTTGSRILLVNLPQEEIKLSFSPIVVLPTGDARRNLGNGKTYGHIPLWGQKTWGAWIVDVGGGYGINPAPNKFNHFYGGGKIRYNVTKELLLGVECYYSERTSVTTGHRFILNAGGQYYFTKELAVLLSAGHTVSGAKDLIAFLGLEWDW